MTKRNNDREIVATRVFDAPRELVFEAWTDPERVGKWWGPNDFTTTTDVMDVKPGGIWLFIMHGPDGRDYKNKIVYIEVVKPERLVYKHSGDEDTEPVNFHVTVTFAERGGKSELTMRMVFEWAAELDRVEKEYGAIEGLNQTLARLGDYLTLQRGGNR